MKLGRTLRRVGYRSKAWLGKNQSTILTIIAAGGFVATVVFTARGTIKASANLEVAKEEKGEKLTKLEFAKAVVPAYIPAAGTGMATLACMFGANILDRKKQASLISAYALLDQSHKEYKNKLVELYGEETHQKVVEAIACEKAKDVPIYAPGFLGSSSTDFGADEESRLFYDSYSGRYFESTIGRVLQAEYHLNRNFMLGGYQTLNDFYEFLGLEKTADGNVLGWTMSDGSIYWIDFNHYKTKLDDGLECFIIDMVFDPTSDFLDDV